MFEPRKEIETLSPSIGRVSRFYRSLNMPEVALPGQPVEEAKGYICVLAEDEGFSVLLVVDYQASRQSVFFGHDGDPVPQGRVEAAVLEGLEFFEELGFILEECELDAKGGPPAWLRDLPFFSPSRQAAAPARDPKSVEKPAAAGAGAGEGIDRPERVGRKGGKASPPPSRKSAPRPATFEDEALGLLEAAVEEVDISPEREDAAAARLLAAL
ncbi:MAG: hypothetical protein HYR98_06330 [Nitrospirae bacterium]|nr:hypothetical protein [Nitrospirota bacterium]MBI3394059.1 hypothetical protein [Nitrospirota bacterium]